jgi:hypothetical protein
MLQLQQHVMMMMMTMGWLRFFRWMADELQRRRAQQRECRGTDDTSSNWLFEMSSTVWIFSFAWRMYTLLITHVYSTVSLRLKEPLSAAIDLGNEKLNGNIQLFYNRHQGVIERK